MTRRFWVSVALTVPLLLIGDERFHPRRGRSTNSCRCGGRGWIELALATPVVLWGGWPFFVRAWQSIVNRSLNMFTLIGAGRRRRLRLQRDCETLSRISFRRRFAMRSGNVPVYFEAAAVITTLVLLGQVLELRARSRTGAAIKALLGLAPKTARRIRRRWHGRRRSARPGAAPAIACACGRAKKSRSTASSSKAQAQSMNRWSRANRFRLRKHAAIG